MKVYAYSFRNILVEDLISQVISLSTNPEYQEILRLHSKGVEASTIARKLGKAKNTVKSVIRRYWLAKNLVSSGVDINSLTRRIVGVEGDLFTCHICGRRFTRISGIIQHIIYHYYKGDDGVREFVEEAVRLLNSNRLGWKRH